MWGYLIRRIFAVIPVMLVVAVIVFLMLRLTPGDPAAKIAGDAATSQDIAQLRTELGLDRPLYPVRYLDRRYADRRFWRVFLLQATRLSMIADGVEPTVSLAISPWC